MKIKVTQEHIDKGVPNKADSCPIALAAKDAGLTHVSVESDWIDSTQLCGNLPEVAVDFIEDFDDSQPVQPFEFELNLQENP